MLATSTLPYHRVSATCRRFEVIEGHNYGRPYFVFVDASKLHEPATEFCRIYRKLKDGSPGMMLDGTRPRAWAIWQVIQNQVMAMIDRDSCTWMDDVQAVSDQRCTSTQDALAAATCRECGNGITQEESLDGVCDQCAPRSWQPGDAPTVPESHILISEEIHASCRLMALALLRGLGVPTDPEQPRSCSNTPWHACMELITQAVDHHTIQLHHWRSILDQAAGYVQSKAGYVRYRDAAQQCLTIEEDLRQSLGLLQQMQALLSMPIEDFCQL